MVSLANESGRELADRQAAAVAFEAAVLRRGILLTQAEILRQYDRYNQSATDDVGTQQVLGAVLDALEEPGQPNSAEPPTSNQATP